MLLKKIIKFIIRHVQSVREYLASSRIFIYFKEYKEYRRFVKSFTKINECSYEKTLNPECIYRNDYYNERNKELVKMCMNNDTVGIARWYRESDADKMYYDEYYENRLSMRIIAKYIKCNVSTNAKILDAACGHGSIDKKLSEYGFSVKGIDLNEIRIRELKPYIDAVECTDVDHISDKQKYDVILSLEMLEHVPNVKQTLERLHKLLVDKGLLFVSVPNKRMIDDEQHVRLFDEDSLKMLLKDAGFNILSIIPLAYLNREKNNDLVCVCTK